MLYCTAVVRQAPSYTTVCTAVPDTYAAAATHVYTPTVGRLPLLLNVTGRHKREFKSPSLLFCFFFLLLYHPSTHLPTYPSTNNYSCDYFPAKTDTIHTKKIKIAGDIEPHVQITLIFRNRVVRPTHTRYTYSGTRYT